jgi:hypothetical protein
MRVEIFHILASLLWKIYMNFLENFPLFFHAGNFPVERGKVIADNVIFPWFFLAS